MRLQEVIDSTVQSIPIIVEQNGIEIYKGFRASWEFYPPAGSDAGKKEVLEMSLVSETRLRPAPVNRVVYKQGEPVPAERTGDYLFKDLILKIYIKIRIEGK